MKKLLLPLILVSLVPLSTFIIMAQQKSHNNLIYLHEQNKTTRSALEHLHEFSNKGKVVLKIYADWCCPCKRMAPLIKESAATMTDILFINIDRDSFPELAKSFSIISIPILIFLYDGKEIGRYSGGPLTQEQLDQLIIQKFKNY